MNEKLTKIVVEMTVVLLEEINDTLELGLLIDEKLKDYILSDRFMEVHRKLLPVVEDSGPHTNSQLMSFGIMVGCVLGKELAEKGELTER
jgi:hypothetical protein